MTYQSYEESSQDGAPVELYEFATGIDRSYFVSGANEIVRLGNTYVPAPIKRDRIKQSDNVFKDGITLSFPRENDFARQFIGDIPEINTTVTVLRGHYGDPDEEFITYWRGRIMGGSLEDGNTIKLSCESVFTSIQRAGLRARYELNCRHALYGSACGVNREALKFEGPIIALVDATTFDVQSASSEADGYFAGGILQAPSGNSRFITSHVGDRITISRPLQGLAGSVVVALYPGCDHLADTCQSKFSNLDNFGGFPYIPTRNPFDGTSLV